MVSVRNASEKGDLLTETKVLKKKISKSVDMIGNSKAIQNIKEIIELKLNESEKALLASSATSVKEVMGVLDSMNLF